MSNLDALIKGGVIPEGERGKLSTENLETIDLLTAEEVRSVVSIFKKVGGKPFFEEMYCHAAFF